MSKAFGKRLRTFRKQNSTFSQQDMADMLKICRSTYTYYETGKSEPGQEALRKICNALNVDFNTMLGYDSGDEDATVANSQEISALSVDEEQILAAYRSMNSDQKASLVQFISNILR